MQELQKKIRISEKDLTGNLTKEVETTFNYSAPNKNLITANLRLKEGFLENEYMIKVSFWNNEFPFKELSPTDILDFELTDILGNKEFECELEALAEWHLIDVINNLNL